MTTIRLTARLIRGAGRAGLVRLALMTGGIGIGVLVLLTVVTIPGVLNEQSERFAARSPSGPPQVAEEGTPTFLATESPAAWEGTRVTRVFVASTTDDAPLPPGVDRLPGKGEIVLSPAARELRNSDAGFANLMPGRAINTIDPKGLVGPAELVAYIGTDEQALESAEPVSGWGLGGRGDQLIQDRFGSVPFELAALVALPAGLYLLVCARLSSSVRRKRYAALRLLGLRRRTVVRVAAAETVAAGIPGVFLGLALYTATNRLLGPSELLGFSWYPSMSSLTATTAVFAVVGVTALAAALGASGARWALDRPLAARGDVSEQRPRWWLVLPLVFGLGVLLVRLLLFPLTPGYTSDWDVYVLFGGAALVSIGLLLWLGPLVRHTGRFLAAEHFPLALRLAGNRLLTDASGHVRLLAALAALILVAGAGSGLVRQTELAGGDSENRQSWVSASLGHMTPKQRRQAATLPAAQRWITQYSTRDASAGAGGQSIKEYLRSSGVKVLIANCADARKAMYASLTDCRNNTAYRISSGDPETPQLPADYPVPFSVTRGEKTEIVRISAPDKKLDVSKNSIYGSMSILVTSAEPLGGWRATDLELSAVLDGIEEQDRFASRLAAISPTTVLQGGVDVLGLETSRSHKATLRFGSTVGFGLGLLALLIASLDRAVERRRRVAGLVVLGTPRRTIRRSQLATLVAPLAVVLPVSLVIANLAGNALLRPGANLFVDRGDPPPDWYLGTFAAAAPVAGIGLLAAFAAGTIVVGTRPRAEDLRRE